jgi:hypothetical protein
VSLPDDPSTPDLAAAEEEELFEQLRSVVNRVDPVPPAVVEAARVARAWRRVDTELAELLYDSRVDRELAGVRSSPSARQLTFQAEGLRVEIEVTTNPRRIAGQLVPAQPAEVEVRHRGGAFSVPSDRFGHFQADGVPSGPLSLRCHLRDTPSATSVDTSWIVV